jgi:hypothetical protein
LGRSCRRGRGRRFDALPVEEIWIYAHGRAPEAVCGRWDDDFLRCFLLWVVAVTIINIRAGHPYVFLCVCEFFVAREDYADWPYGPESLWRVHFGDKGCFLWGA